MSKQGFFFRFKKFFFLFLLIGIHSSFLEAEQEQTSSQDIIQKFFKDEPVQINQLSGGYSGAGLYLIRSKNQTYVARFLNQYSLENSCSEIKTCLVASQHHYGPKIHFSDINQGWFLMEHLINEPLTEHFYPQLACLVRSIHEGPVFSKTISLFDEIQIRLNQYKDSANARLKVIPDQWLLRIQNELKIIQQTLKPHLTVKPCHRDLHKNNLFFTKGQFKAIDFEMAAQDDPFIDLATLSMSYEFTSEEDSIFLKAYLQREPTEQERSKFYLTKQLVSLFWGFGLVNLTQQNELDSIETLDLIDEKQKNMPLFIQAAHLIKQSLRNFNSKDYQKVLKSLNL